MLRWKKLFITPIFVKMKSFCDRRSSCLSYDTFWRVFTGLEGSCKDVSILMDFILCFGFLRPTF